MSIEKNINSRVIHKHDIEANWLKAIDFIPKQAEIIIYDIDSNYSYERFKIGDGITTVNALPFVMSTTSGDNNGTGVQSDWNQNDTTALDYIKNRIAWVENTTQGEIVHTLDSKFLPIATANFLGAVSPNTKTEVDIQPVTIDENGKLWTEPSSNTVVSDDGEGNVILTSLATEAPENIVTDDGEGNLEIYSTSLYNPFPGVNTAIVGQLIRVAEIDENNKPIRWETFNLTELVLNDIVTNKPYKVTISNGELQIISV